MTRRPGLSLTEVLVALFIMGIGTIAILTLFPLGALNMAQAFRDDRCTQAAGQADAILRYYVKDKAGRNQLRSPPPTGEGFVEALDNPNYNPDKTKVVSLPPIIPGSGSSSYPVAIDPIGYLTRGGTDDYPSNWDKSVCWVGDNGIASSGLARRSLRSITRLSSPPFLPSDRTKQQPLTIRSTTLLDGFGYDPNTGSPATVSTGGSVDRDLRYNWLWVIQRLPGDSATSATMTVVVFDKRSPSYVPPDAETAWVPSVAAVGQRQLQFLSGKNGGKVPTIQKGGWLLDATILSIVRSSTGGGTVEQPRASAPSAGAVPWVLNAQFYRVAGTTDDGASPPSQVDVELDTPLRPDTANFLPGDPVLNATDRRFIYLSGVAEVFERDRKLDFNP